MIVPCAEPSVGDYPLRIVETLRFADTDRNGHITSSVFAICCQSGRLALLSDPARGITPSSSHFVLASSCSTIIRKCSDPAPSR